MSPNFSPETSALLLIDYQVGTMQLVKNLSPDLVLRNAIMLAKTALAYKMPIFVTSSQEDHIQGVDASGSSFEIGEETSRRRMERAGVWLTSTNTMVAELIQDWSTPQGQKLSSLLTAGQPMLLVD